jgi:amino acid transporter
MLSIILSINIYFSGMSSLTVTSRHLYSMARDGCFPCSKHFRVVTEETGIPIGGVLLTLLLDILLILLNLISPTAFVAVTSIATIGYQVSYAIPIYLRVTGFGKKNFKPSLFHLGDYSIIFGYISLTWLLFTSVLFLLPTKSPVTIDNLSWSPIIVGGTVVVMSIYWVCSARFWFVGPVRVDYD